MPRTNSHPSAQTSVDCFLSTACQSMFKVLIKRAASLEMSSFCALCDVRLICHFDLRLHLLTLYASTLAKTRWRSL